MKRAASKSRKKPAPAKSKTRKLVVRKKPAPRKAVSRKPLASKKPATAKSKYRKPVARKKPATPKSKSRKPLARKKPAPSKATFVPTRFKVWPPPNRDIFSHHKKRLKHIPTRKRPALINPEITFKDSRGRVQPINSDIVRTATLTALNRNGRRVIVARQKVKNSKEAREFYIKKLEIPTDNAVIKGGKDSGNKSLRELAEKLAADIIASGKKKFQVTATTGRGKLSNSGGPQTVPAHPKLFASRYKRTIRAKNGEVIHSKGSRIGPMGLADHVLTLMYEVIHRATRGGSDRDGNIVHWSWAVTVE